MTLASSWQFVGSTKAPAYRFFDWLRCRLNERLVRRLLPAMNGGSAGASPSPAGQGTPKSLRVLEAGSGPGFATSLFASQRDVQVAVCVDIDVTALREGRSRDAGLLAVVADMRAMPFCAGSFALVFNSSTLEHLENPASALNEMKRVCTARGRVFVGVPYVYGPLAFEPLVRRTAVGKWLGPVFGRRKLERLLLQAGLRPVQAFRYFWNFFIGVVAVPQNQSAASVAGP